MLSSIHFRIRSGTSLLATLEEASGALASCLASSEEQAVSAGVHEREREFSTSSASNAYKFQTNLRKPRIKCNLYNWDNLKKWQASNFSLSCAETILKDQHSRPRAWGSDTNIQHSITQLISETESLSGLLQVVQPLGSHMAPHVVLQAFWKAGELKASSGTDGTGEEDNGLALLVGYMVPHLQPHLSSQPTRHIIRVLDVVCKTRYSVETTFLEAAYAEFEGSAGEERLANAKPADIASLMRVSSRLGWNSTSLWSSMCQACITHLTSMTNKQLSIALRAMSGLKEPADVSSQLWKMAEVEASSRLESLATEDAQFLASILRSTSQAAYFGQYSSSEDFLVNGMRAIRPSLPVLEARSLVDLSLAVSNGVDALGQDGQHYWLSAICDAASHIVPDLSTRQLAQIMDASVQVEHVEEVFMKLCADVLQLRTFTARHPHPDPLQGGWQQTDAVAESGSAVWLAGSLATSGLSGEHPVWNTLASTAAQLSAKGQALPLNEVVVLLRALKVAEAVEAGNELLISAAPTLTEHAHAVPKSLLAPALVSAAWVHWHQVSQLGLKGASSGDGADGLKQQWKHCPSHADVQQSEAAVKALASCVAKMEIGRMTAGNLQDVRAAVEFGCLKDHELEEWLAQ